MKQTEPVSLRTNRLLLRPWQPSDLAPFAALNADPEVRRHFPGLLDREASDAAARRMGGLVDEQGWGIWAVESREDGAFLGCTGLAHTNFDAHFTPAVEVAWRLVRSAWGNGYATEAAGAALAFAAGTLELAEVVSFTVPGNVRSIAVMQRLHMTRDPGDDFDHPNLPPGHPLRPHVLYRTGLL